MVLAAVFSFFISGCGGSDDGGAGSLTGNSPKLANSYIAKDITVTLANCSDPNDNGSFTFDDAVWTISSQAGSQFESTIVLTKNVGDSELKTTVTAKGAIDLNGKFSGTLTSVFTVDGVVDSSGGGSFDGTLSGDKVTLNFVDTDELGDTCVGTGTITFSEDTGTPTSDFGSLNLAGDVASDIGTTIFSTAINQQNSSFSWSNLETTVTVSNFLGTTSVKGKSGTAYACACLPTIDLNGKKATFTDLQVNTSFPFAPNSNTKTLTLNGILDVPDAVQ